MRQSPQSNIEAKNDCVMGPPPSMEAPTHSVFSVQELMKEPLTSVPPIYVVPGQDSLGVVLDTSVTLPVIDFNLLVGSDTTTGSELSKLHSTCKEWGFFQLVNHGVGRSLLAKLKEDVEQFCELPLEEKMKYGLRAGEAEGFGGLPRVGGHLDWADRLYMITNPVHRRKPHLFPELPSSLRNTLEEYTTEMQKLGMNLITLMGKALGIDVKVMEEKFEDGFQSLRLTYYPPCPEPELVMGLTNHSDASGLTILNQVNGFNGLQIKKDGVWFTVDIQAGALVVNVGDILEIMTNGVYKSIEHRATTDTKNDRTSVAFFFSPQFETEVGPIPYLVGPDNPPMFKRVSMEKYVTDFFSRTLDGRSYLNHLKTVTEESTLPKDKHI